MNSTFLHRLCAWPEAISWIIAASILNGVFLVTLSSTISRTVDLLHADILFPAVAAFITLTLLGWFLSWFVYPFIRKICTSINGRDFSIGESVLILRGKYRMKRYNIYEVTTGQGGQPLLRLYIGQSEKEKFLDLFEEYAVTRQSAQQDAAANP